MIEVHNMETKDPEEKNPKVPAIISLACALLFVPVAPIIFGIIALRRARATRCGISLKICAWIGTIIGTLSIPGLVSLAYAFYHLQEPEWFQSSCSFNLTPPPAILNLQSVDRDNHLQSLVSRHTEGLNSQQLRANVILRLDNNPTYKSVLLAPFLKEGIIADLGSTFNYSVTLAGSQGMPRFIITSSARSALGAKHVADVVQLEYAKLHKNTQSEQIGFAKQTLEDLLENSLNKERTIAKDMNNYKKMHELPHLQDEKTRVAYLKERLMKELADSKIEQIRINSLLRQILEINSRIISDQNNTSPKNIEVEIARIKEFFEIDAIKQFENVPALRQTLHELEKFRKNLKETGSGYLDKHPKMLENTKKLEQLKDDLGLSVRRAIEDLKDKYQLHSAEENEFGMTMTKLQMESEMLGDIEDMLGNFKRQLAVVQKSTDSIHARLSELNIEQALPSEQNDPLRIDSFAYEPSIAYFPDKQDVFKQSLVVFAVVFVPLLGLLFLFCSDSSTKKQSTALPTNLTAREPSDSAPDKTKS